MTERFKGLDLIEYLKYYGQRFVTVQEAVIKIIQEKESQKGQMIVWGGFTNSWEKEEKLKPKKKLKDKPIWMQSSKK